ncbi:MAG: D-alanyl-D-alanine carboxypeptidase [Gammaproteobacteria bacterium]|nr:D-alanyl-D-alanine carboxypeptidase [Gammaproteobacteria bacterium]
MLIALVLSGTGVALAAPVPSPPSIAASGHLLIDFDSGRVLSEKNADQRLEPASLTKIMSAYVVLRELKEGNISLAEQVVVSEKAWRTPGSRMFIEVDTRVSVEDLLKGMIIQSGNDASVALAEHIAGSESTFANLMNEHAHRLGMDSTHFVNSTGLPDKDHYTTAGDIAKVSEATIREFPEYYPWYAEKEFTYNKIKQHNRNKLLWRDDSIDGIKTGHTEAAGYCLVTSAAREGMRLISVVMGTSSENERAKQSQSLLNYGFRFFETHRLYAAGETLNRGRVWKGDKEQLAMGLAQDLYVTIPRRRSKDLRAEMSVEPHIMAPISKGRELGRVTIELDSDAIANVPLVALEQIHEGGILRAVTDSVLLWFE